ncbi:hypothetical protein CLAFUW4_08674 [Fulvia fulva]|nr:hypothetical protein CLAFUR4_08676 [Fulvia fulva]WPV12588.1 hypothetical protein CLAFUW4_08674 [Fulvia fulva]WPV27554.1 hypothetical protein CLAFUW7_08671 [Fulvia fulva]
MTSLPPTHRALLQEVYGEPLLVKDLPTPQATSGSAVLKILCSPTISYMRDVYNGKRQYPYSAPIVPGTSAIARVAAVGSDATFLQPGELVYFDCMIHSRDDYDDAILIGLAQGGTEGSKKMMEGGGGMGRLRTINSTHISAGIQSWKRNGRVALIGGLQDDISIPHRFIMRYDMTLKGKWMYSREECMAFLSLFTSGVLNVRDLIEVVAEHRLEDWEEAFQVAWDHGRFGQLGVFKP